jgi:hypothetical protein
MLASRAPRVANHLRDHILSTPFDWRAPEDGVGVLLVTMADGRNLPTYLRRVIRGNWELRRGVSSDLRRTPGEMVPIESLHSFRSLR